MSSNKGTSSNSGGGGGGNNNNNSNNNQVVKEITKEVKKNLGLTAVGGIGAGNMGYVANNLTGRDKVMYGEEAATETKKAMANRGLGTYNAETGSFSNVVGNKIISGTDKIMYGNSGVMGSGDPTGVLSSIAISQPMFESQQKLKTLISGGMALMGIPFIPSAMAYDARRASYESYANNFAKAQSSASFTARYLFVSIKYPFIEAVVPFKLVPSADAVKSLESNVFSVSTYFPAVIAEAPQVDVLVGSEPVP